METRIENDDFVISTTEYLDRPYLGRKKGLDYRTYWHFVKDFAEDRPGDLPPEVIDQLRERAEERNRKLRVLRGEDPLPESYDPFFNEGLLPYDFQARASHFITEQKKVLLADDVGLGKTLIAITAMFSLIEKGLASKFVIVCPASLRLQWLGEFRKFINRDHFPDFSIMVIQQSKKERKVRYRGFMELPDPAFLIVSYAMLRDDVDMFCRISPDMVVLDEAHKIKTRTTKTNAAVRKAFGDTKYRLGMTATPIENGLEDLYCITEWLDRRRWRTKKYFYHRYCVMGTRKVWRGKGNFILVQEIERYKNIGDARQKLTGLYVRRTVGDVALELPAVTHQNIIIPMDKDQWAAYKEVKGDIYGELTKLDLIGQMTFLQEICDSPMLLGRKGKGAKVKELKRLLDEDFKYQKIVAVTRFKKFAKIVKKELGRKYNLSMITGDTGQRERQLAIDDFSAGTGQKILLGTTAIEEGLNLQAGSVLINLDLPWNPAKLHQRIGRIYRIGSEYDAIRMVNLITENTIEERVLEVLYEKGELFEQMFHRDENVQIAKMLDLDAESIRKLA